MYSKLIRISITGISSHQQGMLLKEPTHLVSSCYAPHNIHLSVDSLTHLLSSLQFNRIAMWYDASCILVRSSDFVNMNITSTKGIGLFSSLVRTISASYFNESFVTDGGFIQIFSTWTRSSSSTPCNKSLHN
jgi:hypothetical protein